MTFVHFCPCTCKLYTEWFIHLHSEVQEILITRSTDIGWSPYFPILKGVVTELGGLISHGAVVAREYRLPCLVGASGATDSFQTGDLVCLDTSKGVLALTLEE